MSNPKTTILGVLMILGAVIKAITDYMSTGTVSQTDLTAVLSAIGGVGLIFAKDGGK